MIKLGNIGKAFSSRYFKADPDGDVYNLKATDFDEDYQLINNAEPSVLRTEQVEKYILADGDVILVIKGPKFFAYAYRKAIEPAVAASSFALFKKLDQQKIFPEYLAWFLNHPKTQKELWGMAQSTSIPSISLKNIKELKIPLPPMEHQKNIVKLDSLFRKERRLKVRLSSLKETLFNEQLYKTL